MSKISEDLLKRNLEIQEKHLKVSEDIRRNQEFERADSYDLVNRVGHLEAEFKSLKELVLKLPQQTSNKVSDSVDEVKQEVQDFKDVLFDQKVISLDTEKIKKQIKRHFWQFWKRK